MRRIMRFAVVVLLAAFSFPAISQAKSGLEPTPSGEVDRGPVSTRAASPDPSTSSPSAVQSLTDLAAREQQAKQLADFRGGGVYIYAGSGALLVVVIVLLVLLI